MTAMHNSPPVPQPEMMVLHNDLTVPTPSPDPFEPQPPIVLVGSLVSLRFVLSALRRRCKVWLSLAVLGLLVGIAYHAVIPRTYGATATLYLAHSPATDPSVAMTNDLALLQTKPVSDRAAALLGDRGLTQAELLGKAPGTVLSSNILSISVSGPSQAEAVRRANAVADAFLSFRTHSNQEQYDATAAVLRKEITPLQQKVSSLTTQIADLGTSGQGNVASALVGEQSGDSAEIASLQQTLQQDQVDNLTAAAGSRVLTPGTPVHASTLKLFGLSGISGLIAGLTVGMAYVALQAIVSKRLRRRDELASVLGAPVEFSLQPIRHPKSRPERWIRRSALNPRQGGLGALAGYLRRQALSQADRTTLLVIALDDLTVPAAALAVLAMRLADEGQSVLAADLTSEGLLASGMKDLRAGGSEFTDRPAGSIQVFRPSDDEMSAGSEPPWVTAGVGACTTLSFTTIDPARGAWHLSWAKEAVITVTAGRSNTQRVSSTAALLRAAGITIRSGVLLGADAQDESIGLLQPDTPLVGLPIEGVVPV